MQCLNYNKTEWQKWGLLVLRVVLGGVFIFAGLQKFAGLADTTTFFQNAGIPLASILAPVVAAIETLGGIALLAGVFTCAASAALTIVMIVATLITIKTPMFTYPLVTAAALFTIFTSGPGAWTLGGSCKKECGAGDSCSGGTCNSTQTPGAPQQ